MPTRLWLDSVLRRSPILIVEDWVVAGRHALLDRLDSQLRPVTTMVDSCAYASSSSATLTNLDLSLVG
ncbi:hypothetical protein, partial [Actinomyces naeslundii]|uniref:hypothetical protein n=1 Tax=Actinomyces naeslundii TaxID=1655 RepID=UPI001C4C156C